MGDKLTEICEAKREHVAREMARRSFAEMDRLAFEANRENPVRGFSAALRHKAETTGSGLICEIKKASPSAGLIRPDFDPAALAQAYEHGGAACLSVLTDEPYFQGCNAFLQQARAMCDLPVLRKDFMVDVWQIAESRVIGADCILLIMAALDDHQALELHAAAMTYGLDVLIEIHNREELERALRLPSQGLIGINNRNLKTLQTDLEITESLAPSVPEGREIVSESGLVTPDDLRRMKAIGVNRFLIGESLMKQPDVAEATKKLCVS